MWHLKKSLVGNQSTLLRPRALFVAHYERRSQRAHAPSFQHYILPLCAGKTKRSEHDGFSLMETFTLKSREAHMKIYFFLEASIAKSEKRRKHTTIFRHKSGFCIDDV
jgi:hypothetical protein